MTRYQSKPFSKLMIVIGIIGISLLSGGLYLHHSKGLEAIPFVLNISGILFLFPFLIYSIIKSFGFALNEMRKDLAEDRPSLKLSEYSSAEAKSILEMKKLKEDGVISEEEYEEFRKAHLNKLSA
jgi:hypothetical protein